MPSALKSKRGGIKSMNQLFENLFIFEMANNHQGDVEHGLDIIRAMGKITRKYNIKAAVKLQYRDLETFIHPDYMNRNDVKHIPRFLGTRMEEQEFSTLVNAIKEEGMFSMSTPFDEASVNLCMDHGIDIIKIASCSALDWPLLTAASATRKPLIVSTGGKKISDIDKIFNFLTHRENLFAFLHCIALYPTPAENLQLDFIHRLSKRYPNVTIGYSGHEDPNDIITPMLAVAKGAQILERHVGIATDTITLNAYSMNPNQADAWVKAALDAKKMCSINGNGDKYVSQDEVDSLNSLMRGVYVNKDIPKGTPIKEEDIFFAMPCLEKQMNSGQFYDGIVATKDYKANDGVFEIKKKDNIAIVRNVIHDAKGMLYEAGIPVGSDFEVELSHHYGMAHFRQNGALIINIINREYCKKLIIVLPGQKHPIHHHKLKEETFQLLYGDLQVDLEGKVEHLKPGDILTVPRMAKHSFTSSKGAIFEEISTTHVKKDSYYADEKISRLDPIERKTILRNW